MTRVNGETGTPIVLLHGLVGSSNYWGAAYDTLASHHRLIAPDLLGFGRSPRPASGYGPDDHAAGVLAALDELDVREPAALVGHSLGVIVALRLAATEPTRVASVVGFGPPLHADRDMAIRHVGGTGPMGRLFVLPGPTAELACRWVCDHREIAGRLAVLTHPSLPRPIAADSVQHTWQSYSETLERMILSAEAPLWLPAVQCPVQLVVGHRDSVVDRAFLRAVARANHHVDLLEWHGGHDLPLSHADECVEVIERSALSA